METLLSILQITACVVIIGSILLQQPAKGGGLALGGGGGGGGGQSTNAPLTVMFKITMGSAVFLLISSLFLGWYHIQKSGESVIDANAVAPIPALGTTETAAPANPAEAAPAPVEETK